MQQVLISLLCVVAANPTTATSSPVDQKAVEPTVRIHVATANAAAAPVSTPTAAAGVEMTLLPPLQPIAGAGAAAAASGAAAPAGGTLSARRTSEARTSVLRRRSLLGSPRSSLVGSRRVRANSALVLCCVVLCCPLRFWTTHSFFGVCVFVCVCVGGCGCGCGCGCGWVGVGVGVCVCLCLCVF